MCNQCCFLFATTYVNGFQSRNVQLIQYGGWPERAKVPGSPASVLKLLEDVVHLQQQTGKAPVIVHCMLGTVFDYINHSLSNHKRNIMCVCLSVGLYHFECLCVK